jgi:NADPH-dependent 2,4-dienoyl-CoA reductase/sulfur reductase-like enzyme
MDGLLPGKRAVIIGSGDIGLIMARRLAWSGCSVEAVVEIMDRPSGLPRNLAQCLEDFGIPLLLSHATTRILGADRVEAVEVAPLSNGAPDLSRARLIPCDTVLLSVGLIPENELSRQAGVAINPMTGGARVDSRLMTSVPGIFACGNVLHIHDLVDGAVAEARRAGRGAARWIARDPWPAMVPVAAGANLRYLAPSLAEVGADTLIQARPLIEREAADLVLRRDGIVVDRRTLRRVRPQEILSYRLAASSLGGEAPEAASAPRWELSLEGRD